MNDATPAGNLIDSLGVTLNLPDGHLAADAVIVVKVIGDDGVPYIKVSGSASLDWITRRALLDIAAEQEHNWNTEIEDDE